MPIFGVVWGKEITPSYLAHQASVFPVAIARSLNRNNSTLSSFDKGIGPCFAGFQIRAKSLSESVDLCGPFRQAQRGSKSLFMSSSDSSEVECFMFSLAGVLEFCKEGCSLALRWK